MTLANEKKFLALPPKSVLCRIERATQQSLDALQAETLAEKRARVEKLKGESLRVDRKFPIIGRGCVMGSRLKTRAEINQELDKALVR